MSTTRPPAYQQTAGQVEASRRGAHRARAKPLLASLPIIAGVLVVLAAVGGVWYVLGDRTTDSSPSVEAAAGSEGTTATPSTGSSATATPRSQTSGGTSGDTGSGSAGSDGSGKVDQSLPVRVLNSLSVGGLAKRVAADVQKNGWTVSDTGNSRKKDLPETKVYYGTKADRTSAQALVKDLGFGTVVADPQVADNNLVVVLGQDAQ